MAATFTQRELYGGAITVELPTDFIDSSTFRQIPDHQEVFLSPTTLTSIIFEINTYVDAAPPTNGPGQEAQPDLDAAQLHFTDVLSEPDTLSAPLAPAQRVQLSRPPLSACPAYLLSGSITSFARQRRQDTAAASVASSSTQASEEVLAMQLLVRIPAHGTDLIVRMNAPTGELAGRLGGREHEETLVQAVMERMVASLELKDEGLFGA